MNCSVDAFPMRGRLITFEGPEGSGKSTQIQRLAAYLRAAGREVLLTREPGGTRLAERIRSLVREETDDPPVSRSEVLLFLAARAQLVSTVIKPALAQGQWVLCDRFTDSTLAYQGYGRGLNLSLLKVFNAFAAEDLKPDLTLLLDVPPAVSRARLAARQAATDTTADRIEEAGEAFHTRLRDGFLDLARAEPDRFVLIDATRSSEEVQAAVTDSVRRRWPE
jgi:dTMP kinase